MAITRHDNTRPHRTVVMTISPNNSLLRILAHIDQKISDPRLISDVPSDDTKRAIALEILTDLRDALEEVGRELNASPAKRRPT
jgi:hypothetical protein